MRYLPFAIYAAVTVVILGIVLSDFFFGRADVKRLAIRVALAFIWPLAALSRPGRDLLFNTGREL